MPVSASAILEKLDKAYRFHYDPVTVEQGDGLLVARYCYKQTDQAYIFNKKITIWSAETNEHVFVFRTDELTPGIWDRCQERALQLGLAQIRPHSEHRCSLVTALVVCGRAESKALELVRSSKYHKDYRLGFFGWMEFRAAALCLEDGRIAVNRPARDMKEFLEQNLSRAQAASSKEIGS